MQANGYNDYFYHVPNIISSFGLCFGFVGLLGIYDDKLDWVWIFNLFLITRLLAVGITMAADYHTLRQCGSWLSVPGHSEEFNPQMYVLASQGICPSAQWAYLIGCSVDFAINAYFTFCCWCYYKQLVSNPSYEIDFGHEKYDVAGRWRAYQVEDPSQDYAAVPLKGRKLQKDSGDYGAIDL